MRLANEQQADVGATQTATIVNVRPSSAQRHTEEAEENPNCFVKWYPSVLHCGIPSPKTIIMPLPIEISIAIANDGESEDGDNEKISRMIKKVVADIRENGAELGYPLFVKNGLTSAKHDWQSSCCFTADMTDRDMIRNLCNIINYSMNMGPGPSLILVLREMLQTEPAFVAFNGKLPIKEEYRFFARKGEVLGYQPYWPADAIRSPDCNDWRARLDNISQSSPADLKEMTSYASAVTAHLGGYYSVDFLKDKHGKLWLIDMALGEMSYKSPNFIAF